MEHVFFCNKRFTFKLWNNLNDPRRKQLLESYEYKEHSYWTDEGSGMQTVAPLLPPQTNAVTITRVGLEKIKKLL